MKLKGQTASLKFNKVLGIHDCYYPNAWEYTCLNTNNVKKVDKPYKTYLEMKVKYINGLV